MKQIYRNIFLLYLLFICSGLLAIDVGDTAPFLRKIKILSGIKKEFYFEKNKISENRIFVIYFWSTWSNSSYHLIDFIDKLNRKYKGYNVIFIGISKEKKSVVDRFLSKLPELGLNLCLDPTAVNYNIYMFDTKGTPLFFIVNSDKKILWKGNPFELNRVLSRIVTNTYDENIQRKIEKHRQEMRQASDFFNNKKLLEEAKSILELDPTDLTALNFIVDNFIKQGEFGKALSTVENSQKDKKNRNIFFLKDSFNTELNIIRVMPKKDIIQNLSVMLNKYYSIFNENSEYLIELVNFVIDELPYEVLPLEVLNKITERSLSQLYFKKLDNERKSLVLAGSAKVFYLTGLIDKAIKMQTFAIKLLNNEKARDDAEIYLEYYKKVKQLGNTN